MGHPKIGSKFHPKQAKLSSAAEELLYAPEGPTVIGSIPLPQSTPAQTTTSWESEDGTTFTLTEPPPPWEADPRYGKDSTDARRFLQKYPSNVMFRWINPRVLDSQGWRDWEPVRLSDKNFALKEQYQNTLADKTHGYVRKGEGGPFLAYMLTTWVESRKREKKRRADQAKSRSQTRQETLTDLVNRGDFGRYVRVDGTPKIPTHTQLDGRLARQDTE